jgi:hypothetical protein
MENNTTRLTIQNAQLDKLEDWLNDTICVLERMRDNGELNEKDFKAEVRAVNRIYEKDYNDIFAG